MNIETVYLAGPINHVDHNGIEWREQVADQFHGYEWVSPFDPMDNVTAAQIEQNDESVVEQDLELIRGCDALLANWEQVPQCGTPMEIFYAKRIRNIPVFVATTDTDLSPWLQYHADCIEPSLGHVIAQMDNYG